MFAKVGKYNSDKHCYKFYSTKTAGMLLFPKEERTLMDGHLYSPISWGITPLVENNSCVYKYDNKVLEGIKTSSIYSADYCERSYAPLFIFIKLEEGVEYSIATWTTNNNEDLSSIIWLYSDMVACAKYGLPKTVDTKYPLKYTIDDKTFSEYGALYGTSFYPGDGDTNTGTVLINNSTAKINKFVAEDELPGLNTSMSCFAIKYTPPKTAIYMLVIGCTRSKDEAAVVPPDRPPMITRSRSRSILCTPAPLSISRQEYESACSDIHNMR